ncbi:hypothetical protein HYFRA_00002161 [Hymenoscyphus fraxineus]|uniref:Uncharacterized protein n=1 Tax=Hymenoscyphus fraxineus TaxID=746836 RepID=A0A9N9KLT3_9HELO|nr:hypothetical protein HYFRA_00002161 [Hymenoscyphus fraxineus]
MFDLVNEADSTNLIRELYEDDRFILVRCHGAATLLNVKLADGSHLIAGESVTGFRKLLLTDRNGGHYEKSGKAWEPHVVVSSTKKLLWGQNSASAQPLAVEVLKKIKT